jgi:YegS/Rv2252/BmrU family lipid kinase
VSQGEDPRRLPGGSSTPTPPEPVQVQWPQTVAVIFNPSSGGDTASEGSDHIREAIEATGKKLIWLETTAEDSGQGMAKQAVEQGADVVIACGGDGTVMACATGLAGSQVPLAVLPLGTGNLAAANFDIPDDLDGALEIALTCRRRRIDLGKTGDASGDGRFVIAAGMGFDAAMLRDANHTLKARIGPLAYVWSALRNLRRPRATYRLRLDGGQELTRRAQGVLVANLGKIQGGLPILPDAVPDDGQFDIAVLKTRTLGDWVGVAARILVRRRKTGPDVDTFRARTVAIRCDRDQPVQFDGDVVDPTDRLHLEIDRASLTLAVPEHQEEQSPPARQDPQ